MGSTTSTTPTSSVTSATPTNTNNSKKPAGSTPAAPTGALSAVAPVVGKSRKKSRRRNRQNNLRDEVESNRDDDAAAHARNLNLLKHFFPDVWRAQLNCPNDFNLWVYVNAEDPYLCHRLNGGVPLGVPFPNQSPGGPSRLGPLEMQVYYALKSIQNRRS
ncbi:hypothetical protein CC85DRAFT_303588 [Cutaneotrichosporon oleaginosum]|uniref:Uncharacterized protein n=1 Tax=Cutaneotrichosporon oleaginosum TaxID=879819 RepID=A0A0J0XIW6_9TREE|nr:uncharacterized protein CC85DRAFT_303588 [Cutaneotrichosporon oleaginosum]KLT41021.1 hypothetical protein CC85DRAFT_303588 [Cutaneotrichosporon oleaginosum]TXT12113.1 hypothetical protein COLE_02523 [Cutaneotrichosporon oleaginosum]